MMLTSWLSSFSIFTLGIERSILDGGPSVRTWTRYWQPGGFQRQCTLYSLVLPVESQKSFVPALTTSFGKGSPFSFSFTVAPLNRGLPSMSGGSILWSKAIATWWFRVLMRTDYSVALLSEQGKQHPRQSNYGANQSSSSISAVDFAYIKPETKRLQAT